MEGTAASWLFIPGKGGFAVAKMACVWLHAQVNGQGAADSKAEEVKGEEAAGKTDTEEEPAQLIDPAEVGPLADCHAVIGVLVQC